MQQPDVTQNMRNAGGGSLKRRHKGCWLGSNGNHYAQCIYEVLEEHVSEADAATSVNVAEKLGFKNGDLIQEFGYDDDVDLDLRDDIEDLTGSELLDEEDHEVADAVILWWRDGDGDLVDSLMDSLTTLSENGIVWVLTPKSGRDGYVSPADIQEAAPTAGLHVTTSAGVSKDWSAARLVSRKNK
jgi:hypothetical protein